MAPVARELRRQRLIGVGCASFVTRSPHRPVRSSPALARPPAARLHHSLFAAPVVVPLRHDHRRTTNRRGQAAQRVSEHRQDPSLTDEEASCPCHPAQFEFFSYRCICVLGTGPAHGRAQERESHVGRVENIFPLPQTVL